MNIRLLLALLVWNVLVCLPVDAAAQQVIIATENARAEYEGGIFTAGKPEFRYRFEICAASSEKCRCYEDTF